MINFGPVNIKYQKNTRPSFKWSAISVTFRWDDDNYDGDDDVVHLF